MNNRIVEDAIEVHTPDGIRMIAMPAECSVARVGAMVLQIMDCAGYESIKPERGGAFAFAPKVYEDEVAETPFDRPAQSLFERIQMIPSTRASRTHKTATGFEMSLFDYATGQTHRVSVDEAQPDLRTVRPAGGE